MLFSLVQLLAQTNMKGNMMTKTREQDEKTTKGSKTTKVWVGAHLQKMSMN
jgi:hypothetical protein